MAQINKNLAGVRRRLMWPTRESFDDGVGYDYLIDCIDQLVTEMGATGEPHFLMETPVHLTADRGRYPLDGAPNFGRARFLYTAEGAIQDRRVPIEIVPYEMLTEQYGGGDTPGGGTVSQPQVPAAAAAYYLQSSPGPGHFLEFGSVPSRAIDLTLIYEPDVVRPGAKEDTGFRLQQFDAYLEALAALRGLPHCRWRALSEEATAARKAEIRAQLLYDIGSLNERRGYAYLFWQWRQRSNQTSDPTVIGWAHGRR